MSKEWRTRKITVRFTPGEFSRIEKKFEKAVGNSRLSYYVRNVLLEKPVTLKYRNESLDGIMEEIISLKHELNAIGNNFNQAVKKLHVLRQIPEFRNWITNYESYNRLFIDKANQIEESVDKISKVWLQG